MKYKQGDRVDIKKDCHHEEIRGKRVLIDHIGHAHSSKCYFVVDPTNDWIFLEIRDDDIVD